LDFFAVGASSCSSTDGVRIFGEREGKEFN
jgi:hypothetical protein